MNRRVLVMVASRDRPHALARMIDSVRRTAPFAGIAVYLDDDQRDQYPSEWPEQVVVRYGVRMGPCGSLNSLVRRNPGYDLYGAATDDCTFENVGWDRWLLDTHERLPQHLGVLAPALEVGGGHCDFPWVTSPWLDAVGYFCHPGVYHFYWDLILEDLATSTGLMRYAGATQFRVRHDEHQSTNLAEHLNPDAKTYMLWRIHERRDLVARIRQRAGLAAEW